jgi:hypothetical protein
MNTAKKSSSKESMTACLTGPPSLETSEPPILDDWPDWWISWIQGSLVSLTVQPDSARVPLMTGISGPIPFERLATYDPDSSFWRTSQASLWEMTDGHHMGAPWSDSWPRSGMTRNGALYPLPMQGHRTFENDGGLWPTPTPWQQQESIESWTERRVREKEKHHNGNGFGIPLDMAARIFPTPSVHEPGRWPTPRANEIDSSSNAQGVHGMNVIAKDGREWGINLTTAVKMWNTPNTMDSLSAKSQQALDHEHETARPGRSNPNNLRDQVAVEAGLRMWNTPSSGEDDVVTTVDGSLNPDWVSWLMGLPLGWTSLEPLSREEYLDWFHAQQDGTWWQEERGLPRVATGIKNRVSRLKCLGNGIVPASLARFLCTR